MWRILWLLMAQIPAICSGESCDSTGNRASLVIALKRWYHAGCLFLVNSGTLQSERSAGETNRLLSKSELMASNLKQTALNNVSSAFKCNNNRPLYAILADEEDTMNMLRNLRELPSYPRWLVFLDHPPAFDIAFHDVHVPFDCELLVASCLGENFQLTEVYRVGPNLPLNLSHFGAWSPTLGLDSSRDFLYERRTSLQGLVLSAAGIHNMAMVTFSRDERNNLLVGGYCGRVITALSQRLHFKLNVTQLHGVPYGTLSANGTWDGMVKMVMDGALDLAIDDFTMNSDRQHAVQFLKPIILGRARLYIRKVETVSLRWTNFLAPFAASLWLGILASILLISHIFAASAHHHHLRCQPNERPPRSSSAARCLLESFFSILGMFCQQGPTLKPVSMSSRVALLMAGTTSIVCLAAYSAALTSFITINRADLPFDTIQGFMRDGSYKLGMPKTAVDVYFAKPRSALFQELYSKFIAPHERSLAITTAIGMAKICTEHKHAWLTAMTFGQAFFTGLPCEVVSLPEYLLTDSQSFIVAKHSPYRRVLNYKITFLQETGLMRHMYERTWPTPFRKLNANVPIVTLRHVLPIVAVLGAGIAVSVLLLTIEKTVHLLTKISQMRKIARQKAERTRMRTKLRNGGNIRGIFHE